MFGRSVLGNAYNVKGEYAVFQVVQIKPYPKDKISERYKGILKFHPDVLVAISYRGTLIPNIILTGGVVRLLQVEVEGKIYDSPKAICEVLGVKEVMWPYELKKFPQI